MVQESLLMLRVRTIVAEFVSLPIEKVREDTLLFQDLGIDSMDRMNLLMEIETVFHFEHDIVDGAHIRTVADLVQIVAEQEMPPENAA